jgi:predicted dehydrogenase
MALSTLYFFCNLKRVSLCDNEPASPLFPYPKNLQSVTLNNHSTIFERLQQSPSRLCGSAVPIFKSHTLHFDIQADFHTWYFNIPKFPSDCRLVSASIKRMSYMSYQTKPLRVLVVGCGNMGASHALAYHTMAGVEICGLVSSGKSKIVLNEKMGNRYPLFDQFEEALSKTGPDAVCISTYPDTHEQFAIKSLENGCHVFIEKPLADTVEGAVRVAEAAKKAKKKLVVGYILRHHPSWERFVQLAHQLGKPLVMRMNLNQQSHGNMWTVHRNLMGSLSPIVDCGVHYIDVMCQMTRTRPVQVSAIGARLTEEIPKGNYNYGQLQIRFEDGSVGWYEAGWGPMMSETAFFVKDVIGPKGSVSIVAKEAAGAGKSDSVESHTKTESLRYHHAALDENDQFIKSDEWINLQDEPDHQELCNREQRYFLKAIVDDIDLTDHVQDAVNSLRIAFACDESVRTGKIVAL